MLGASVLTNKMKVRLNNNAFNWNRTRPLYETNPMVPLTINIPSGNMTLCSHYTTSQQLARRYIKHQTMVQILRTSYILKREKKRRSDGYSHYYSNYCMEV